MQFELPIVATDPLHSSDSAGCLRVGASYLKLQFVPNRRARRYILRLTRDGTARVTIPRSGSALEARRFAERSVPWLEKQVMRQAFVSARPKEWVLGMQILLRGEPCRLEPGSNGLTDNVCFSDEVLQVKDIAGDLRPEVEKHLWRLAARELPLRTRELAALHQIPIRRVTVRNQRSRWGSCSRHGTISLNWRLVQVPPFVRDYILLHELAHVKEMNHSRRFWREVARLCPQYLQAERWLKQHSELLL